ncbi:hypothetical protein [Streptomyces sp. NPDC054849]
MNDLLCAQAANPALPSDLVDRLIAPAVAGPDPSELPDRSDELVTMLIGNLA